MRLLTVILVTLAVGAVGAQQPAPRDGVVSVQAIVLDRDGVVVPNLQQQDFTILDNGKPQEVVSVQNDVQPFTVVVLMDFSFSMHQNLVFQTAAAEQFVLRMLPKDAGQAGAFSDKLAFSGAFTNNPAELVRALRMLPYGNPSRLYDAIDASVDLLDAASGRKVVLVFTDGDDTASRRKFGDVLTKTRDKEVMVYAIALQSEFFNGVRTQRSRPSSELRKLADETGGGYLQLKMTDDLPATFGRVAQQLHNFYTLSFAPATDGKRHKLEIRAKAGMTVRARRSYVASRGR